MSSELGLSLNKKPSVKEEVKAFKERTTEDLNMIKRKSNDRFSMSFGANKLGLDLDAIKEHDSQREHDNSLLEHDRSLSRDLLPPRREISVESKKKGIQIQKLKSDHPP